MNSGGDNIAPQRIEGILTLQPEIEQAMVFGDRRPHLVALIVPSADFVGEWAGRRCDNFGARRDSGFGEVATSPHRAQPESVGFSAAPMQ